MNSSAIFAEAQRRAAVPGSAILTAWALERAQARRADVRNDTIVSSSDPRLLDLFGASKAAAGVAVTATSAMRVAAVYACVTLIAGAVAGLPLHLYRRTSEGRDRVEDSPLWWLLNEQPTAIYSATSWWEHMLSSQLLRGDGFTFIGRDRAGNAVEFFPLPWQCVQVTRDCETMRLKYYVQDAGRVYGCDQDDMLHFPGFGFDGTSGRSMSVISWAARNATGTALAMDEYSGRFFSGGAHPSIVLQTDKVMSDTAITNLQTAFANKFSGVSNAHQIPLVLTEGLKAEPLSINADDAQLLDARRFQVIDIARAFGVPPHMIGETSASTSWGSGVEHMSQGFVRYTLNPWLRRIEQELNRKLFRTAGRFVEYSRDALLQGDSKAQAEYFRAALGGPGTGQGWMTADEIRKLKNLPPRAGIANDLYDPRATAPTPSATGA